ncbi:hypothetical protein EDD11_000706 [Mortierella claussenii]|nr:hypothetical protein EDD11_000706 [Mortierella claussenii]
MGNLILRGSTGRPDAVVRDDSGPKDKDPITSTAACTIDDDMKGDDDDVDDVNSTGADVTESGFDMATGS